MFVSSRSRIRTPPTRPTNSILLRALRSLNWEMCGFSDRTVFIAETRWILKSYATLFERETAAVAFTDPPYNVPIDGHVSGNGRITHREFAMASGEMSEAEFTNFLTTSFLIFAPIQRRAP